MNYYEHHLGDYAKDTTSLSMLEEGAYRRLIDVYYAKELPLPGELAKVFKIARAISKPEKSAVQSVLDEFFTLTPDGYRHKRCDEEIERYQISQEGADAKRENDKLRQERARERRKALFEQLRSHGVVAPWDAKTHELEAHLSRVTSTNLSRVTTRLTRHQSPDTRHQIQTTPPNPRRLRLTASTRFGRHTRRKSGNPPRSRRSEPRSSTAICQRFWPTSTANRGPNHGPKTGGSSSRIQRPT